jgi:hypothetical protein
MCLNCGKTYWFEKAHTCGCSILRIRNSLVRLSHQLPVFVASKPKRSGRCDCPFCSSKERRARARSGMPMKHPERILRNLADEQEALLTRLAADTWPASEYLDIVIENDERQ